MAKVEKESGHEEGDEAENERWLAGGETVGERANGEGEEDLSEGVGGEEEGGLRLDF